MILQNTRIGSNVIIGAGTLVNKDIPDNSVVAGIPARFIGYFDAFIKKRLNEKEYPDNFSVINEAVDAQFANYLWKNFYDERDKK